ncbi:polysaccharide export protein [Opitutaceae bacterium TAV4]|uniref:polysaccharide biosynthesis/export family protein n=1 Tax=Geminisphaera colitermitum TaxID=1148786 RepID=UPI000158C79B|nr:polysaccharide biosynthesis/export family protein [Geminisphaera colitermitum]RRJ96139.1 polysaccharide export protein [Opitutaceae bacterium TAV4]RRK00279.1 polysaccharide export protein [Opitutaceae bacterium TAV3]
MFRFFQSAAFFLLFIPVAFAQQAEEAPAASKDYQLIPSDLLRVMVHQEDDLTREVSVSQDYTISLPLIGNVDVKHKSVRAVEELIRDLYAKDFLQNPQVSVIVLRYAERIVSVMGAVNQPGPVIFPQEKALTLVEALARAGGINRLGNPRNVRLTRVEDGVAKNYVIDVRKLIEASTSATWTLQVGDVIFVEEKIF